ncbi:hypothetical protein GUITHDRAFT_115297 [Guillardia theta CCMP2712]|uniref:Serine aminopeptidase S33 domain-containing protein n=2 Tax=Guillardia theta TaxID=55529 RepID=L1IRJ0_GUITC|nr:hypothetical protein GUITHDRAFT_115297 [Guillardia theta CCMP2712]EKX38519.1 hypothetical protein GUITHDRAFT_115297 [Guillardia theta CCMP2712]|mmetsp:Transcript_9843/g.32924  ORF Transcript_9843/g.32924 Transcript_9843/m.32924 type:complete len:394 (+) Transcript_9843:156-1337(+)|eukprot:XP_005825499.1 hypothetical protein GUITHDRAFT_115297 [Guillardia theta CCMP2712]
MLDLLIWLVSWVSAVVCSFCCGSGTASFLCGNELRRCRATEDSQVILRDVEEGVEANEEKLPTADEPHLEDTMGGEEKIARAKGRELVRRYSISLWKRIAVRALFYFLLSYILAAIIVALVVLVAYTPFPSVGSSDCKPSCASNDAYCCTYLTPDVPKQDVYITMDDGTSVHGWWIPSYNESNTTLLYNHGSGGNIASNYRLQRYRFLRNLGLNLFVYDYPGYGKSSGASSEASVMKAGEAALDWVLRSKGRMPSELFCLGRSMGSAVAVDLAAKMARAQTPFRGLILESAFTSYKDAASINLPVLGWIVHLVWAPNMNSLSLISRTRSCLFEYHSKVDEWVPYAQGEKLFSTSDSPASCKEWVSDDKARHDDPMPQAEQKAMREWISKTRLQ